MTTRHKQTAPRLRFKGFDGAWEEKTIFELAQDNKLNNGVFNDKNKAGRGYKLINVLDMYLESSIDENTLQLLDLERNEFLRNKVVYGDVFFTRSSLVKEGIAYSNVYLGNSDDITYDGHLIKLTPNQDLVNPIFLNYELKTTSVRQQFITGGKTTTMTTIGQQEIGESTVILPQLPEQTQLGNFFRELDHRIAQSRALWEKNRQLKKAMLAKMFPATGETAPKIRFKGFIGEWERKTLGDIATIKTGISNREDSDLLGEYTFFDRSQDVRRSSRYLYDCEAVIMAGEGSEFPPKYFVGKFDLHQRSYAIMDFRECDGLFIFYYLHLMNDYFYNQAVGSTVKSLRLPMFTEMPIIVPTKAEQSAIGNFFRQLDDTIALHALETEKLGQLKKALLTAMLV